MYRKIDGDIRVTSFIFSLYDNFLIYLYFNLLNNQYNKYNTILKDIYLLI